VPVELAEVHQRGRRFLLHIHPKVDVWNGEGALRFVGELRSVDPTSRLPVIAMSPRPDGARVWQGVLYAFGLVGLISALMIRGAALHLLA